MNTFAVIDELDWLPAPSLWREPPAPRFVARVKPHRKDCICAICVDYPSPLKRKEDDA